MAHDLFPDTNLGKLAVSIYDQDIGEEAHGEARNKEIGLISGWLEGHLGELNNLIYTSFSGNNPEGLNLEEQSIMREMYISDYNRKAQRKVLNGSANGSDFLVIKEGDSMIQKPNQNLIAKSFQDAYDSSQDRLKDLVYSYNLYGAKPNQVYGADATSTGQSPSLDSYYK